MARFPNTSVLIFSMAVLILAASTAQSAETGESVSAPISLELAFPPEEYDDYGVPPEASPELFKYLESCVEKMEDECGEQTVGYLFSNEPLMTDTCCMQLVAMGRACHRAMVNMTLSLPDFKAYASIALPKSDQLWDKCEVVSREGLQLAPVYN